jgi:hypothetical protein
LGWRWMEFAVFFSCPTDAMWYFVNICPAVLEKQLITVDDKRKPSGSMFKNACSLWKKNIQKSNTNARKCKCRSDCIFNFEMPLSHNLINQRPMTHSVRHTALYTSTLMIKNTNAITIFFFKKKRLLCLPAKKTLKNALS